MCSFFGGKGYNQYMDYKLLAIKLSNIFASGLIDSFNTSGTEDKFSEMCVVPEI